MDPSLQRALLRRYEPVIRFTRGEQFYPMEARSYVAGCSLWVRRSGEEAVELVPEGSLTLDRLARPYFDRPGSIYYLKYVEPLSLRRMALAKLPWRREQTTQSGFDVGPGRLARVGYFSRFVDALFSLTLLGRGRVPGDTGAAAVASYRALMEGRARYGYHGRVVRQGGWWVVQYWFLYAFNNWRSSFCGANDHECDWEMMAVYLSERPSAAALPVDDPAHFMPEWVAFAAHDYAGDDLRRRWDDPEVTKMDSHPVIFSGAGSHANYFAPGEYLTEIELPFLAPLIRATDAVQRFAHETLRFYRDDSDEDEDDLHAERLSNLFRIPFVDYARGDGLAIGSGGTARWEEPVLLDPAPGWVTNFRGLWGLYTRDPFAGEDAPAGPMYNRDGTVRRSWYDPVGWAGLDKIAPYHRQPAVVEAQIVHLRERQSDLTGQIEGAAEKLVRLNIKAEAASRQPHLAAVHVEVEREVAVMSRQLDEMRAEVAHNEVELEALARYAERLHAGDRGPLRAHISRAHRPMSELHLRLGPVAEVWAAVSVVLLLFIIIVLAYFFPHNLLTGVIATLAFFTLVEASFHGQLTRLVNVVTVLMALAAAAILAVSFWLELLVLLIVVAGSYLLLSNLRELMR